MNPGRRVVDSAGFIFFANYKNYNIIYLKNLRTNVMGYDPTVLLILLILLLKSFPGMLINHCQ